MRSTLVVTPMNGNNGSGQQAAPLQFSFSATVRPLAADKEIGAFPTCFTGYAQDGGFL